MSGGLAAGAAAMAGQFARSRSKGLRAAARLLTLDLKTELTSFLERERRGLRECAITFEPRW
jgi:hypothetical protein